MESNRNLQYLIERAGTLNNNFSHEIKNSISLCRLCSGHGRYCATSSVPFEEKESLNAIRYLLKDVENRLISLQRLQSCQQEDKQTAIRKLEESRLHLLEKVIQHQGRNLDVLSDMKAFLADHEYNYDWKPINKKTKDVHTKDVSSSSSKRPVTGFLISCFRFLFNPLRWQKVVVFAVKFLAVSASISSTIQVYEKLGCSGKNLLLRIGPAGQESKSTRMLRMSKDSLDVCHGMG